MLAGILFLTLIVGVAVVIAVDVLRTPTNAPAVQADRPGYEPERAMTGVRGGTAVQAFAAEPAARETPVPAAAAGVRLGARHVEVDSFERPDAAARSFDQIRPEVPQPASEAALRGKFNAMYGNMSRRSQALVERQLRIIESLEHGEQDQQRLAALSKVSRIAMRMHRNSRNLLVLAGQEPGTGWNQPVTLANLVEAALGEIEDYQRVSSQVQPGIAVRGPAVYDAVHVLVELIDNATSFSSAEMPVHVTGRILTTGGALVDITDRGIGMPAKEMAFANQQLDNPPPPDIDVPKWMGLLVVARLAARHGIRVRLNQAESGGLTAMVWFPDEILTHYSVARDPGRVAAEQRGAVVSPAAFASARMTTQDVPAARTAPVWAARSPQATLRAEPAARLSGPAAAPGSATLSAAPRSVGATVAPGPAAAGLPRRPSLATQSPSAVPGMPPGAPNRSSLPSRTGSARPDTNAGGQDKP